MSRRLVLAGREGVFVAQKDGDTWSELWHGLSSQQATCVSAQGGVILVGTTEGIFRSEDLGSSWQPANAGLEIFHLRWLAAHSDRTDTFLAGTEPAGIFLSQDNGQTWQDCPEVAQLRDANGWFLPYSPEAGAVRGFAILGERAYAAVEVGGVLVSDDGGKSWRLAPGSRAKLEFSPQDGRIHSDVHSIEVYPGSAQRVYAPTGGGFFVSEDGARTWSTWYSDIYCRAVWVDPQDPQHIILGPADGVDRNGRIEETRDGGQSWQKASQGLDVPWRESMVERFLQVGDELLAVLSDGRVFAAQLGALQWQQILADTGQINALARFEV